MSQIHGARPLRGSQQVPLSPVNEGRFGRLFRRLSPAPMYAEEQLNVLAESMRDTVPSPPGGWGSAPAIQPGGDNPSIPAAYTYLGQFIDHDITFDPNSSLDQQNDPDALHDFRTPRFDLDSLYGSGPADEPFQYVPHTQPARLLVEPNQFQVEDLPRTSQGVAIIGDPRNDENIMVSQLHLLFAKFHNKMAALVEADLTVAADQKMRRTQEAVRWTYQQMIIFDYLVRTVGPEPVKALVRIDPAAKGITAHLDYYKAKTRAYMPIEFSAAAFRIGHSQVRGVYDLNSAVVGRPVFAPGDPGPLADLRGRRPLPGGWTIDWSHFVDLPGAQPPQPSRLLDTHISDGLFTLPGLPRSLPLMNLLRGQSMSLPSGQDVARFMRAPRVLSGPELGTSLDPTPLWFYILKEAELLQGGLHLGPVGGRIVAEVLIGLLFGDKLSWVNVDPSWRSPIPRTGEFPTLAEIVLFVTNP